MTETTDRAAWLATLRVGDEVAMCRQYSGGYNIAAVTSVTPKRIRVGVREYDRETGRERGAGVCGQPIYPLTAKIRHEIHLRTLRTLIKDRNIDALADEQVEAIAYIIRVPERAKVFELVAEFVNLCAVGDVDETTDALGWGDLIRRANLMLAGVRKS